MQQKWRTVPVRELDRYEEQFRALHKDWRYFHKLIEAYEKSTQDAGRRKALEMAFLDLKGRVSCDYTVLTLWRNGAKGIPAHINDVFSQGTSLASIAKARDEGDGRLEDEWMFVDASLGYLRQVLIQCHEKTKPGKAARLPDALFHRGYGDDEPLERQRSICRALHGDWRRISGLLTAYLRPGADHRKLELELMRLKNKISCEYPTLPAWFGGRDDISKALERILDGNSTLAALTLGGCYEGRTARDLRAVDDSITEIRGKLSVARACKEQGEVVDLAHGFLALDRRYRFPFKRIVRGFVTMASVCLVIGTVYFLRTFVGVGAPAPGAGIEIPVTLEDEEQVSALIMIMDDACVQGDVDKFMVTIASDFSDDEGNGRRALRMALQAYNSRGNLQAARVIWARATFTRVDDWIYANPVIFAPNVEGEKNLYLRLGFKQHGGKWLISSAEGYG